MSETERQLETDTIFEAIRAEISIADKALHSDDLHRILDEITQKAKQEQEADASLRETME